MIEWNHLDDLQAMARTIYGEGRGEDQHGRVAIGQVIMNRVKIDLNNDNKPDWWGEGIKDVCLRSKQFSCWNIGDPNRDKIINVGDSNTTFLECIRIAAYVMAGDSFDLVHGATHYHTKDSSASWSIGLSPCVDIGNHLFYKDVP